MGAISREAANAWLVSFTKAAEIMDKASDLVRFQNEIERLYQLREVKVAEPYKTLREAFEEKVEKKDGKWVWKGSVNSDGYPKMRDGKDIVLASHVSLKLNKGQDVPKGKVAIHGDDNPKNIAPSNLTVGTQKQNLQEMEDKGRWVARGPNKETKEASEVEALRRIAKFYKLADFAPPMWVDTNAPPAPPAKSTETIAREMMFREGPKTQEQLDAIRKARERQAQTELGREGIHVRDNGTVAMAKPVPIQEARQTTLPAINRSFSGEKEIHAVDMPKAFQGAKPTSSLAEVAMTPVKGIPTAPAVDAARNELHLAAKRQAVPSTTGANLSTPPRAQMGAASFAQQARENLAQRQAIKATPKPPLPGVPSLNDMKARFAGASARQQVGSMLGKLPASIPHGLHV